MTEREHLPLPQGAEIAVIGGGPAGAFFSIYAMRLAKDMGKKVRLTIFDRKTFTHQGPAGCNMCAGVISESMVQSLAIDGINLQPSIVQRSVDSYCFHSSSGEVYIRSPYTRQRGIATTYRGGGPKGSEKTGIQSFDEFLMERAAKEGAILDRQVVDEIHLNGDKPKLYSGKKPVMEADLLVGAFGVNALTAKKFEDLGFGYTAPATIRATQAEMPLGKDWVSEHFGNAIHVFLLNLPGVKFAAITPKGEYATISLLGKDVNQETVKAFLSHPLVQKMLPTNWKLPERFCHCFPKINVGAARKPYGHRIVIVGDAASTRLYKDGIGSAYVTGKAAAQVVSLYGIGEGDFLRHYSPVCKEINRDNLVGRFLFGANDFICGLPSLSKGYFRTLQQEQKDPSLGTPHSDMLWDMFTGSRSYKDILFQAISPRSQYTMVRGVLGALSESFNLFSTALGKG